MSFHNLSNRRQAQAAAVCFRGEKDLEDFLINQLTPIPGVARIYTSLVLNEVKSSTRVPIDNGAHR